MTRTRAYALAGGLLSAGAPLGLLGIRLATGDDGPFTHRRVRRELAGDRAGYAYVSVSTAIVFTVFGWVLGRQADRLSEMSRTDALSGLLNARGFFERLAVELSRLRRYREPLALLLVDVDGLKRINDLHGHHAGDMVIRGTAEVIRSELRDTDAGARWGGDEFAIVAPNTGHAAAVALAERVRRAIAAQPSEWPVTGSVGVATIEPGGVRVDSSTLMRMADMALYDAKMQGKDMVVAQPLIPRASKLAAGSGASPLAPREAR